MIGSDSRPALAIETGTGGGGPAVCAFLELQADRRRAAVTMSMRSIRNNEKNSPCIFDCTARCKTPAIRRLVFNCPDFQSTRRLSRSGETLVGRKVAWAFDRSGQAQEGLLLPLAR